ncbi:MAG: 50S ribosomal protein L29 [Christensenellaceae bacterium]|jgi:large subunit ribosomal protein L29|nr:50S ribosomal protein L29 [Christensenellaceae bacterium]
MKAKELYELSSAELVKKIEELKIELFNLRFKHASSQLPNPQVIPETKKDIARALTILKQRELGLSAEPVRVEEPKKARKVKKESK